MKITGEIYEGETCHKTLLSSKNFAYIHIPKDRIVYMERTKVLESVRLEFTVDRRHSYGV